MVSVNLFYLPILRGRSVKIEKFSAFAECRYLPQFAFYKHSRRKKSAGKKTPGGVRIIRRDGKLAVELRPVSSSRDILHRINILLCCSRLND